MYLNTFNTRFDKLDDTMVPCSTKNLSSHTGGLPWASYQMRKIAGCACAGNAGNVFPRRRFQRKPVVSDPGMCFRVPLWSYEVLLRQLIMLLWNMPKHHSRRQWITSIFSPTTTFPVMISRWFIVIALCVGSIMRYVCMSISLKKMQFILHHFVNGHSGLHIFIRPTEFTKPDLLVLLNPLQMCVFWSHRRLQYLETTDVIENNIGWNRNGYLRMHSNTQTCIEKRKSERGAYISKCVKPTCAYLPLIL